MDDDSTASRDRTDEKGRRGFQSDDEQGDAQLVHERPQMRDILLIRTDGTIEVADRFHALRRTDDDSEPRLDCLLDVVQLACEHRLE